MADAINARNEPLKPFPKPSEGTHQCVCVDVIDLGYHNKEYAGQKKGYKQYCALVWQIDEENPDTKQRFEVAKDFLVSMFEQATLRKLLEQWRGKTYTEVEAEQGVPLHKLVGQNGLMQIEHAQSKTHPDRTYTNIVSITPLPRAMQPMTPAAYQRDRDRWSKAMGITWEQANPPTPVNHDPQFEESVDAAAARINGGFDDGDDNLPF